MKNNLYVLLLLFWINGNAQEYSFIPKNFVKIEKDEFFKIAVSDTLKIKNAYLENGKNFNNSIKDSLILDKSFELYIQSYYLDKSSREFFIVYKKQSLEEKKARDLKLKEDLKNQKREFKNQDNSVLDSLELKDINDVTYSLESLKDKVIVLNFWFVKCKPCVAEIPDLNKIKEKYKDKDVVFFAITFDSKDILSEFTKKKSFDFTLIPSGFKTLQQFKIKEYPTTIIIDKEQKINLIDDLLVLNITKKIDKMIAKFLEE